MYIFVSLGLIFLGGLTIGILVLRALPRLAETVETPPALEKQEAALPSGLGRLFETQRLRNVQRLFFLALEKLLRLFYRALNNAVRYTDRLLGRIHAKALRLAGARTIQQTIPRFFSRLRYRRAFIEEERKLLEQIEGAHEDIDAWWRLARLYIHDKRFKDANAALREILHLKPDDEDAKRQLEELEGRDVPE